MTTGGGRADCNHEQRTRHRRRRSPRALATAAVAIAALTAPAQVVVAGFTSGASATTRTRPRTGAYYPQPLRLSTKEEAAPQESISDVSPFVARGDGMLKGITDELLRASSSSSSLSPRLATIAGLALIVALTSSAATHLLSTLLSAYAGLLLEHPVPTKSLTSGFLCGCSDTIAQFRDTSRKEFNFARLVRFAG